MTEAESLITYLWGVGVGWFVMPRLWAWLKED